MFDVDIKIDNLKGLNTHIKYVDKLLSLKDDKQFQRYFQQKFLETVNKVANDRIIGGTTNDEEIDLYKSSNKIQEIEDGFILYNDAKIPADFYNTLPFDTSGYSSGQFSIALAFEYGTGMVAVGNYDNKYFNPWQYDSTSKTKSKHHKNNSWYLPKNVYGESGVKTYGYKGFEVYRYTAEEIQAQMPKWLNDYFKKYGGVSS